MTETGGEGGFRGGDTLFCAGHFRGVSADEMVHYLVVVEFGDGREDTTGVAGQ